MVPAFEVEKLKAMINITDKPLADKGLISYRYKGTYGYIMIGAHDDKDALHEAARSSSFPVIIDKLEIWDGEKYTPVKAN